MSQLRGATPVELSQISIMSCPAPGDCTAAGSYTTPHRELVFIANEQDGTWGPAENLAGSAYVSFTGFTGIKALSCVSPGNCSVGGDYDAFVNNTTFHQAFVATETNGTWHRLREVPGTNVLNAQFAATNSMSCTAGGTCTAVGSYESLKSGNTREHPFITSRAHGTWGPVQTVPGLATLPTAGAASARLDFVWCASAAHGRKTGLHLHVVLHVDIQLQRGRRPPVRTGVPVRGTRHQQDKRRLGQCGASPGPVQDQSRRPGEAELGVVQRARLLRGRRVHLTDRAVLPIHHHADGRYLGQRGGDCVAGGDYSPKWPFEEPFLVTQTNGLWGNMFKVSGPP